MTVPVSTATDFGLNARLDAIIEHLKGLREQSEQTRKLLEAMTVQIATIGKVKR